MKKYVFCGAHGTGKSSAVSHLASILKKTDPSQNIGLIPENVREVARLVGGKINSPEFQQLCTIDHIHRELSLAMIYDVLVIDRSALDTLVYGVSYGLKLPSEYFSLALNHMDSYDHVFFVRPDMPNAAIANDSFRDVNVQMRDAIDAEFERFLALWGGKYTTVKTHQIFTFEYEKCINSAE